MEKLFKILVLLFVVFAASSCQTQQKQPGTLKDALNDHFLMGVAVNAFQTNGADSMANVLIKKHFNSIVAENCMKSALIQPSEGKFTFDDADRFVEYGEKNNMFIIGHTLIWHSQSPQWLYVDDEGNQVSREVLIERMKNHIFTVVGRYKGRVHGWDVVNEAIEDDGSYRENQFYKIIGKEYIQLAFEFAHQADPDAELYYNDYNMVKPGRRETVVEMVRELKAQGIKIDGIGIQGHYMMDFPLIEELEKSIVAFADLDCDVMITELDVSALPNPWEASADVSVNLDYQERLNPYPDGLTQEAADAFYERYMDFFNLFIKHSDKISRVTMWGLSDKYSWKNNYPIHGRTDYPLLFDRNYEAKPIVDMIIEEAQNKTM
jgi:endo-1,4-beta-xylanase